MKEVSVVPLFDLQVNGFGGVDFQSDSLSRSELLEAVERLSLRGVAGILFTLITDSVDSLCRKIENVEKLRSNDSRIASMIRGYHLEGPWISREPGYRGAHPAKWICEPVLADYFRLRDASNGNLKLITLAPEIEGSLAIIEAAVKDGIRVGLGHTNATELDIEEAIKRKATLCIHVGNGVPLDLPRHDNVIQRLLARDELIACFIPDGIHLPRYVLKNFFRAKPVDKVFFTTDCMSAAGAGPGQYALGPCLVEVGEDGIVRSPDGRYLAGSSLTMDRALENVVEWLGIERSLAQAMCSRLPAEHFEITL